MSHKSRVSLRSFETSWPLPNPVLDSAWEGPQWTLPTSLWAWAGPCDFQPIEFKKANGMSLPSGGYKIPNLPSCSCSLSGSVLMNSASQWRTESAYKQQPARNCDISQTFHKKLNSMNSDQDPGKCPATVGLPNGSVLGHHCHCSL
jgi:hypothetical protein